MYLSCSISEINVLSSSPFHVHSENKNLALVADLPVKDTNLEKLITVLLITVNV